MILMSMETLRVQFTIDNRPILDQSTRMAIRGVEAIKGLPLDRAEQAWGSTVPSQIVFLARVGDSAVFVTEDWDVTIRSSRLVDCVGGMCTMLSALGQEFSSPVAVELSDKDDPSVNSLYDALDREQRVQSYWGYGKVFITLSGWIAAIVSVILFFL